MRNKIVITTNFPSAAKVAKDLGLSKKVARDLSALAKRSLETGEYVLPGVGRIEPARHGARGTKIVRYRAAKRAKGAAKSVAKK